MNDARGENASLIALAILAIVSWFAYLRIARLSAAFDYHAASVDRPIVQVLLLFALAFACYLVAVWLVCRLPPSGTTLPVIIGAAVIFRLTLLTSTPIQEIDIYRYLWDGAVAAQGVSPFRFSPEQVKAARAGDPSLPTELRQLASYRDDHPAVAEALQRVHFAEVPTVYPPTSQAIFALSHHTMPRGSSLKQRLTWMKGWFVAFDLLTLALVVWLLRLAGQPLGLCVVYAWCPLLMKEVANSGHLDAIAVFLTTLAIALGALVVFRQADRTSWRQDLAVGTVALFVLALAVGAKLYPIILAPLLLLSLVVVSVRRHGWPRAAVSAALSTLVFAVSMFLILRPMLPGDAPASEVAAVEPFPRDPFLPPPETHDPSEGIKTFLARWEMNDFIFLILVENLTPTRELPPGRVAWFSVLPRSMRLHLVQWGQRSLGIAPEQIPFLTTRAITGVVFGGLAIWFAWRGSRSDDARQWLHFAFLTVAWFWLLCPTQNPWYWTWTLPLLPFARAKTWLLVGGVCLVYYLRFWFGYHWPETTVLGTPYVGTAFFDFVVTWFEFVPIFVLLILETAARSFRR